MELDCSNKRFFEAAELVTNDYSQYFDVMYLTGKAGTGKTTFLKYIRKYYPGNVVVLAPTGVAALNAGGRTIHSFFQLDARAFTPYEFTAPRVNNKFPPGSIRRKIIENIDLLIIDEVSMVRCDLLDAVESIMRMCHRDHAGHVISKPFGGVKTLLIGDVFQLPPVVTQEDKEFLRDFYPDTKEYFFFNSKAYTKSKHVHFELDKVYRQNDQTFIDILGLIRSGKANQDDLTPLNARVFDICPANAIHLMPTKRQVDELNSYEYGKINTQEFSFICEVSGDFKDELKKVPELLKLKKGAKVMTVCNKYADGSDDLLYCNGTIGEIIDIDPQCEWIKMIRSDNQQEVTVIKNTWENLDYKWDKEKEKIETVCVGKYKQLPVILAWAITIHKCQGLSFDNVAIDLRRVFDKGQTYVALSRCRSLDGLFLYHHIGTGDIILSEEAKEFSKTVTTEEEIQRIHKEKEIDNKLDESYNKIDIGEGKEAYALFKSAYEMKIGTLDKRFEKVLTTAFLRASYYRSLERKIQQQEGELQWEADIIKHKDETINSQKSKIDDLLNDTMHLEEKLRVERSKLFRQSIQVDSLRKEIQEKKRQLSSQQSELVHQQNRLSKQEISINDLISRIEQHNGKNWIQRLFSKI